MSLTASFACWQAITRDERPAFLKIACNGTRVMKELSSCDPEFVVCVLGGAAGTTRDAFEPLAAARRNGAWVALFDRKIRLAESPFHVIRSMRDVTPGPDAPEFAVRGCHICLRQSGLRPAERANPAWRGWKRHICLQQSGLRPDREPA